MIDEALLFIMNNEVSSYALIGVGSIISIGFGALWIVPSSREKKLKKIQKQLNGNNVQKEELTVFIKDGAYYPYLYGRFLNFAYDREIMKNVVEATNLKEVLKKYKNGKLYKHNEYLNSSFVYNYVRSVGDDAQVINVPEKDFQKLSSSKTKEFLIVHRSENHNELRKYERNLSKLKAEYKVYTNGLNNKSNFDPEIKELYENSKEVLQNKIEELRRTSINEAIEMINSDDEKNDKDRELTLNSFNKMKELTMDI